MFVSQHFSAIRSPKKPAHRNYYQPKCDIIHRLLVERGRLSYNNF